MPIRTRLSVLLVAAMFALAGCGMLDVDSGPPKDVSGMSGRELLEEAQRQVDQAKFLTIKGKVAARGVRGKFHMAFASNSASGIFVKDGVKFHLLNAGGKIYYKVSDKDYRELGVDERKIDLLGGRWILGSVANKDIRLITSKITRAGVIKIPQGRARKGAEKKIRGVDCISLTGKGRDTIYVAKSDGRPLLLTGADGTITYSYVRVKEVKAPAKRDVLDLSKFK
jgi:hypothetical protein